MVLYILAFMCELTIVSSTLVTMLSDEGSSTSSSRASEIAVSTFPILTTCLSFCVTLVGPQRVFDPIKSTVMRINGNAQRKVTGASIRIERSLFPSARISPQSCELGQDSSLKMQDSQQQQVISGCQAVTNQ